MTTAQQEEKYASIATAMQMRDKLNANEIAEQILLNEKKIITFQDTKEIYAYEEASGLYKPFEPELAGIIQFLCGQRTTTHLVNEVIASIQRQTLRNREIIGQDCNLIPLNNGIYNFVGNSLQEYSPEFVFLTKHPIIYKKPEFFEEGWQNPIDNFLFEVAESQNDILLLKELIGYCFYRKMPFQNFFILVGAGANGKSTYLNLIREMLGQENTSNQSLQALTENRFAPASLYNKNANIFGDLPNKAFQDVGMLKQATGGDILTAECKFKNSFNFQNHAKVIASCNEIPETPDVSDAFFRRAVIINFPNSFEGRENRNLTQELCTLENLSHFFNTCIDAFRMALLDNKLIRAESIAERKEKYMIYSNSSASFCQERLEFDPDNELESELIYKEYGNYCVLKKLTVKNETHFFRSLYKFFGNRAYRRRRIEEIYGERPKRHYVIVGVDWK